MSCFEHIHSLRIKVIDAYQKWLPATFTILYYIIINKCTYRVILIITKMKNYCTLNLIFTQNKLGTTQKDGEHPKILKSYVSK